MPRSPRAPRPGGRHELGQNFLVDPAVANAIARIVRAAPPRPVLELAAGSGALTKALVGTGLAVTAVELDPRHARRLRADFGGRVDVVTADLMSYEHGTRPHHVVSNVPFGITTPLLRRLLGGRHWHTAALLLQWEVARKRAAVGGTTMLTATWWPWYDFTLAGRVPATAFRPVPSVSGGILVIRRRDRPLVDDRDAAAYRRLVRTAFTGSGGDLAGVLRGQVPARAVRDFLRREHLPPRTLPRDLQAHHWVALARLRP